MSDWKREIKKCEASIENVCTKGVDSDVAMAKWLAEQGNRCNLTFLLAHADDGVIWGRVENGRLVTSDSVASQVSPPLRYVTLQQARLFGPQAELLLWRDGDGKPHARLTSDDAGNESPKWTQAFDEDQLLWGTDVEPLDSGFSLMRDGAQGLGHAVPLSVTGAYTEETRPLRLTVRHYLAEDDNGVVRIVASRLCNLAVEVPK